METWLKNRTQGVEGRVFKNLLSIHRGKRENYFQLRSLCSAKQSIVKTKTFSNMQELIKIAYQIPFLKMPLVIKYSKTKE